MDDYQRFTPSRVSGLAGVTEVVVSPARVDLRAHGRWVVVRLAGIARWPRPAILRRFLARFGWRPLTVPVADRDWSGVPRDRSFRLYTTPAIVVHMPADEPAGLGGSCFVRVQEVMRAGGFDTRDLGGRRRVDPIVVGRESPIHTRDAVPWGPRPERLTPG